MAIKMHYLSLFVFYGPSDVIHGWVKDVLSGKFIFFSNLSKFQFVHFLGQTHCIISYFLGHNILELNHLVRSSQKLDENTCICM